MIIKNYELNKLRNSNIKLYLLYGENEGHKNEAINDYFILKLEKNNKTILVQKAMTLAHLQKFKDSVKILT